METRAAEPELLKLASRTDGRESNANCCDCPLKTTEACLDLLERDDQVSGESWYTRLVRNPYDAETDIAPCERKSWKLECHATEQWVFRWMFFAVSNLFFVIIIMPHGWLASALLFSSFLHKGFVQIDIAID